VNHELHLTAKMKTLLQNGRPRLVTAQKNDQLSDLEKPEIVFLVNGQN